MDAQIEARLDALVQRVEQLEGRRQQSLEEESRLLREAATARQESDVLTLVHATLDTLLKDVSEEALGTIERFVTYGLQVVFPDKSLQFKLVAETKRGVASVEPRLIEGKVEAPILSAFGGGPAAVVAFLLRLMVCRRLKLAPMVLLDEPFSFLSKTYVPNLAKLLRELADTAQIRIVMVTHDPTYLSYATHAYQARATADGTVFDEVTK